MPPPGRPLPPLAPVECHVAAHPGAADLLVQFGEQLVQVLGVLPGSCGLVSFYGAQFSGGTVGFGSAQFSGGAVDFSNIDDWSVPPVFPWTDKPPAGVKLPKKVDPSGA